MKLCVDCRHFIPGSSKCNLSTRGQDYTSPVDGKVYYASRNDASGCRIGDDEPCGPEGKLWDSKPPKRLNVILRFLKAFFFGDGE